MNDVINIVIPPGEAPEYVGLCYWFSLFYTDLKVPKFSDARKLCCNLPKIQTKRPKLMVFYKNDANGIANSEDPDQTAPLGAV